MVKVEFKNGGGEPIELEVQSSAAFDVAGHVVFVSDTGLLSIGGLPYEYPMIFTLRVLDENDEKGTVVARGKMGSAITIEPGSFVRVHFPDQVGSGFISVLYPLNQ